MNWVECIQYICSIIFVVVYAMDSFCVMDWQWQVGVVAVFLGWINLILFVSKLPFVGIYVIILISISKTFARMLIVTILLIVAFGITFFMIFYDPEATVSDLSSLCSVHNMYILLDHAAFSLLRCSPLIPEDYDDDHW